MTLRKYIVLLNEQEIKLKCYKYFTNFKIKQKQLRFVRTLTLESFNPILTEIVHGFFHINDGL